MPGSPDKAQIYVQHERQEHSKRQKLQHDSGSSDVHVWDRKPPEEEAEPDDDELPDLGLDSEGNDVPATGPQNSKPAADDQETDTPKPETENKTKRASDSVENKLRVTHANLGHPSNKVLVRTLKEAGATAEVLQKAAEFGCTHCDHRGHAQPRRTSQVPHATRKWDVVSVDTFWWHSPRKDAKGDPSEHVVGVSLMDEANDFHMATVVRSGEKKQGSINAEEFKAALAEEWLRTLPKPGCIRFDDEGAFRDQKLIEWIEAKAIRVSVIAGGAAWQVGKRSRRPEVLKENMSLLSSELGESVKAEELLALSLAAKNEMHNIQGYSPSQWVESSQNGENVVTNSL